mmetsp:Transcript_88540/g.258822  ORF Transcript_88540/g.258822 Transcript_88540/m.258822 type:complete len:247 (-) Transcript_88540:314-1054(-)
MLPMLCSEEYATAWARVKLKPSGTQPFSLATSIALGARMSTPGTWVAQMRRSLSRFEIITHRSVSEKRPRTYTATWFRNHARAADRSSSVQLRLLPLAGSSQREPFSSGSKGSTDLGGASPQLAAMSLSVDQERCILRLAWQLFLTPIQHQFLSVGSQALRVFISHVRIHAGPVSHLGGGLGPGTGADGLHMAGLPGGGTGRGAGRGAGAEALTAEAETICMGGPRRGSSMPRLLASCRSAAPGPR